MTQTELDNFILYSQCKIGNKVNSIANSLKIGELNTKDLTKVFFATVGNKILSRVDIDESCLTEDKVCSIARYTKKYFRECGC